MRKNKIKKRWIRGEGIVYVSKKRESFGDLWREKRRLEDKIYLFIYFVFLLF